MNKATLNLFNGIQVEKKVKKSRNDFMARTIPSGFVLSPSVAEIADENLIKQIEEVIGISGTKANASFHKSWKVIKDTPQEELWIQAMIHYLTTYGFQSMGMYRDDTIYIPNEQLKLPEITKEIKLVVIKGMTQDEVLDGIFDLASGVALKEETLQDIMNIVEGQEKLNIPWDAEIIENIQNRELKGKLYDQYDIVPSEPVEYLRFVINKITDESLLIKNDHLIETIKELDSKLHQKELDRLLEKAPNNLAEIFFRFKPIFLALKSISKNKTFFNRLRKKANTLHKPMPEDYLNSITSKIKNGDEILLRDFKGELAKVNIFRKIRLAYALKYRTKSNKGIVYKVRNGRGFATEFEFSKHAEAEKYLKIVVKAITDDLNVKGETIYIPEYINYALPATEKMFLGNFPAGTYISVKEDMLVGVHWFNTNKTVDLDLSTISASGKTGWDSSYSSEEKGVLFSGDVTSAPEPDGASELFYIRKGVTEDKIVMMNYFNHREGDEVEMKLLVAQEKVDNLGKNYMVDVNRIIGSTNVNVSKKQNILGLITTVDKENRFYFSGVSVGGSITASNSEQATISREYLVNSLVDSLDFKEILTKAGANVVSKKPEKGEYLDLSPEALEKGSIINLLQN